MRLLLIRHAQSTDNVSGILGTLVPGPLLTPLGRAQAEAIPTALAGESIQAIYASRMQRTSLTAQPLAAALGLDAQVVDGLEEIGAGAFEGRSDREAVRAYMGTIMSWWTDPDARIEGGETGAEFFDRFTAAINRAVADRTGTVAVFSHGASIHTWAAGTSRNIDVHFSQTHDLPNTAMVVLEGSVADGWITTHWDNEPVGGPALDDKAAPDPTGQPL
ncbi:MAG TPA: histidine phosphatase family protein [Galbitalea sp.]|jgi:probable phosphoglycerate mutase|nr:histidine phosphatase family protein [Galbitalea sp.]